jgi:hypothetical protein
MNCFQYQKTLEEYVQKEEEKKNELVEDKQQQTNIIKG